jgi:hypothetical protein
MSGRQDSVPDLLAVVRPEIQERLPCNRILSPVVSSFDNRSSDVFRPGHRNLSARFNIVYN